MRVTADGLARLRLVLLGLTGLSCLMFSILALVQARPDPFFWWFPGGLGVVSAAALFASSWMAGEAQADMAYDELNADNQRRAAAWAYWVSLALFAPMAVSNIYGLLPAPALIAAFGTAMGAAYLLRFVWLDVRQS
ncbi:MAG: hypothetical protein AAF218_06210 [Pseudomonadota bacterium]